METEKQLLKVTTAISELQSELRQAVFKYARHPDEQSDHVVFDLYKAEFGDYAARAFIAQRKAAYKAIIEAYEKELGRLDKLSHHLIERIETLREGNANG